MNIIQLFSFIPNNHFKCQPQEIPHRTLCTDIDVEVTDIVRQANATNDPNAIGAAAALYAYRMGLDFHERGRDQYNVHFLNLIATARAAIVSAQTRNNTTEILENRNNCRSRDLLFIGRNWKARGPFRSTSSHSPFSYVLFRESTKNPDLYVVILAKNDGDTCSNIVYGTIAKALFDGINFRNINKDHFETLLQNRSVVDNENNFFSRIYLDAVKPFLHRGNLDPSDWSTWRTKAFGNLTNLHVLFRTSVNDRTKYIVLFEHNGSLHEAIIDKALFKRFSWNQPVSSFLNGSSQTITNNNFPNIHLFRLGLEVLLKRREIKISSLELDNLCPFNNWNFGCFRDIDCL